MSHTTKHTRKSAKSGRRTAAKRSTKKSTALPQRPTDGGASVRTALQTIDAAKPDALAAPAPGPGAMPVEVARYGIVDADRGAEVIVGCRIGGGGHKRVDGFDEPVQVYLCNGRKFREARPTEVAHAIHPRKGNDGPASEMFGRYVRLVELGRDVLPMTGGAGGGAPDAAPKAKAPRAKRDRVAVGKDGRKIGARMTMEEAIAFMRARLTADPGEGWSTAIKALRAAGKGMSVHGDNGFPAVFARVRADMVKSGAIPKDAPAKAAASKVAAPKVTKAAAGKKVGTTKRRATIVPPRKGSPKHPATVAGPRSFSKAQQVARKGTGKRGARK